MIIDLSEGLQLFCRLFIENLKIVGKSADGNLINRCLSKIDAWADQNAMLLNAQPFSPDQRRNNKGQVDACFPQMPYLMTFPQTCLPCSSQGTVFNLLWFSGGAAGNLLETYEIREGFVSVNSREFFSHRESR